MASANPRLSSRAPSSARWPTRTWLMWPAPALLGWLLAWCSWTAAHGLLTYAPVAAFPRASLPAMALGLPLLAGLLVGAGLAWRLPLASGLRRFIVASGFPLSALGSGLAQGAPAWAWLLPLALLLLAYPLRAWRDAPLFPTPAQALDGLPALLALPPGAAVLDAGCGLGHGLHALRRCWPQARFSGVEWSWPLALLARLRCPFAQVRRGDMWASDWSGFQVVYLFQRPESMAGAWAKARAQMAPGSWLVSLDFAVPGLTPSAQLQPTGAQPLWLYRLPASTPTALDR